MNEDHITEDIIENAFDINHRHLTNFDTEKVSQEPLLDFASKRKSKEFKENPLYIEFELNNDDEAKDYNVD